MGPKIPLLRSAIRTSDFTLKILVSNSPWISFPVPKRFQWSNLWSSTAQTVRSHRQSRACRRRNCHQLAGPIRGCRARSGWIGESEEPSIQLAWLRFGARRCSRSWWAEAMSAKGQPQDPVTRKPSCLLGSFVTCIVWLLLECCIVPWDLKSS